jgi:hypothetical protein
MCRGGLLQTPCRKLWLDDWLELLEFREEDFRLVRTDERALTNYGSPSVTIYVNPEPLDCARRKQLKRLATRRFLAPQGIGFQAMTIRRIVIRFAAAQESQRERDPSGEGCEVIGYGGAEEGERDEGTNVENQRCPETKASGDLEAVRAGRLFNRNARRG